MELVMAVIRIHARLIYITMDTGWIRISLLTDSDFMALIKNMKNATSISISEGRYKLTLRSSKNSYKGIERGTKNIIKRIKLSNLTNATSKANNKRGTNIR